LVELDITKSHEVFISYSWTDSEIVSQFDQFLRDRNIRVRIDTRDLLPGRQIPDAKKEAIVEVDKVLVFYSENSKNRDWPRFEVSIAEEVERKNKKDFIIYIVLDNTELPRHDPNRIAIFAKGKSFGDVGKQILMGIEGGLYDAPSINYDLKRII